MMRSKSWQWGSICCVKCFSLYCLRESCWNGKKFWGPRRKYKSVSWNFHVD